MFQIDLITNVSRTCNWALAQESLFSRFANNKGADQPAHSHSLISGFDFHVLESIISKPAMREMSIF